MLHPIILLPDIFHHDNKFVLLFPACVDDVYEESLPSPALTASYNITN
jgi:hypothetical protein